MRKFFFFFVIFLRIWRTNFILPSLVPFAHYGAQIVTNFFTLFFCFFRNLDFVAHLAHHFSGLSPRLYAVHILGLKNWTTLWSVGADADLFVRQMRKKKKVNHVPPPVIASMGLSPGISCARCEEVLGPDAQKMVPVMRKKWCARCANNL